MGDEVDNQAFSSPPSPSPSAPVPTLKLSFNTPREEKEIEIEIEKDIEKEIEKDREDGEGKENETPLHDGNGEIDANSPYYRDYLLLMEYKHLPEKIKSGGIYVLPSFDSLYVWHCAIFIRQGIYRSGVFRFALTIPASYPNAPPEVQFFTPVFHPLIGTDGTLDISHEFPDWKAQRYFLCHVLAYIKKIFYQLDLCTKVPARNSEALELYAATSRDAFHARVEECVRASTEHVFENPEGSSIRFAPFTKDMENLRDSILERNQNKRLSLGGEALLAWVSKGVAGVSKSVAGVSKSMAGVSSLISFKY